jgi:hypothetical protein
MELLGAFGRFSGVFSIFPSPRKVVRFLYIISPIFTVLSPLQNLKSSPQRLLAPPSAVSVYDAKSALK